MWTDKILDVNVQKYQLTMNGTNVKLRQVKL